MKKTSIILLLGTILLLAGAVSAGAATQFYYDGAWHDYEGNIFQLKVGGELLTTEVPPVVFNDRSVVPARDVFEQLGATVDWEPTQELITVTSEETLIKMQLDNTTAYVNGAAKSMEIPPKLINEKTMIPVRFVSEELGLSVDFDSKTDTIVIERAPVKSEHYLVKNVSFEKGNGKIAIHIEGGQTDPNYDVFTMSDPDRIVLDITNAELNFHRDALAVEQSNVTQIRIGESENRVRIVVDVTENLGYHVDQVDHDLYLNVTMKEDTSTAVPKPEPTPPETNIPPPSTDRFIVLDAGHGGSDSGALGKDADGNTIYDENGNPSAVEKEINLDITRRVRDILVENGVTVKMTRDSDVLVDLYEIPEIANRAEAPLFVSIHTNSVDGVPGANGVEVWGYLEGGSESAGMTSKRLSELLLNSVIDETGAKNRGVKDGKGLVVVRKTNMPAALVEVGFITNDEERAKLMDDAYRQKLAQGIANGILKAFNEMGV